MPSDSRGSQSLPDLRYIHELAKVFQQYELGEVEIETGEHRILLRKQVEGCPDVVAEFFLRELHGDRGRRSQDGKELARRLDAVADRLVELPKPRSV